MKRAFRAVTRWLSYTPLHWRELVAMVLCYGSLATLYPAIVHRNPFPTLAAVALLALALWADHRWPDSALDEPA